MRLQNRAYSINPAVKTTNLEDALNKAPFAPFEVHIDGKTIPVEHRDQVLFSQDRSTVIIAPRDNRIHIMDLQEIQFISILPRHKAAK